jgi:two-component system sensor histidine kinase AlgZ
MIIKQNDVPLVFSGWRNLGTVLRIVLAVNLGMLFIALGSADSFDDAMQRMLTPMVYVEPYLFLELCLLWIAGAWLARLQTLQAFAAISGITLVCGLVVNQLTETQSLRSAFTLLFWGYAAQFLLLYYFHLRDKALSPAITEAKLQALQARIRPHFLFNSINAVMSIIRYEPLQAEAALQDMADMFRALMRDNHDLAPIVNEIELCRQYLAIEKLRLGDRLNVTWETTTMPDDALMPPLILQPLLENAVLHGIESSPKGGTVTINIFLIRGELHAIMRNPYHAKRVEHRHGNRIAMDNVRERLQLHFDAEAAVDTRIVNDSIWEVHIRVPYLKQANHDTPRPRGV